MINRISLARILMMPVLVICVGVLAIIYLQISAAPSRPLSYDVIERNQQTMQQKIRQIEQRNRTSEPTNSGPPSLPEAAVSTPAITPPEPVEHPPVTAPGTPAPNLYAGDEPPPAGRLNPTPRGQAAVPRYPPYPYGPHYGSGYYPQPYAQPWGYPATPAPTPAPGWGYPPPR